jgi:hypothetical protein
MRSLFQSPAKLSNQAFQHLRLSPCVTRLQCLTIPRRFASTEEKGPVERSFKGQLYDSTYERLQREKAEQARFAALRAGKPRGPADRLYPIIVGMFIHYVSMRESC